MHRRLIGAPMFTFCSACRRYYRVSAGHRDCPAPPKPAAKKPFKWGTWPRPWYYATPADAKIAKKFAKVKTCSMF